jgi:hypothetical protein
MSARFAASTVAMLVKLKNAMNWAITSSRKISPARFALIVDVISPIAAVRFFIVPAPLP